jgi:uncharacterized protein involved in propanediol utilization
LEKELLEPDYHERTGKVAVKSEVPRMKTFVLSTADRVKSIEDKALKLSQIR